MPGVVERAPRRHGPMRQGLSPAGSAARSRLSAHVRGWRTLRNSAMPAASGDVGGDGVDPVERIEEANGRTGAGVGRCGDLKHAVVGPSDAIGCKRRARHVTREPLKLPGIFRGERLSGKNREPTWRLDPTVVPAPLRPFACRTAVTRNLLNGMCSVGAGITHGLSFCIAFS